MVKFTMEEDGKKVIGLGLSDGNLQLLRNDRIIHIDGAEMNLDFDIIIFWGKTENEMCRQFKRAGMITDQTKLKISPDLTR